MSGEDTMPVDAIELRVLHGPQAGARLPLQPGESYTIGAADTCAVVLGGAQVAQEHARIRADAEGVEVEPLQGRVLTLAGQEIEPGLLPLGTVLQFGFVKLTVAQAVDEWPADEVLQVRDASSETVPEEEPAPSDDVAASVEALPTPLPSGSSGSSGSSGERRLWRIGMRRYAVFGAGVLLVGAVAFAAGMQRSTEASASPVAALPQEPEVQAKPAASEAETAEVLAGLLKKFPQGSLHVKHGDGGSWIVEGRLRSETELRMLREDVSMLDAGVEIKVMLEAERREALSRFVKAHHSPGRLELRLEPGAGDAQRIVGSASTAEEAAAFPEQARSELAELEPVEFDIQRPDQVRELFMDRVREAGLGGKFTVIATEPALELRAVLNPQETRAWETLFIDFTRRHGSTLKISAHVDAERDMIATHVAAVVGGAFPYIVTTSGQRVTPGGTLAGNTVVAVRDGEIVLSDGTRFRYGP